VGDLPVRGYSPPEEDTSYAKSWDKSHVLPGHGILWENGFVYDGQLLRLARDLGDRILPAFYTKTGLPYPRVNLRHGVPFYPSSPLNAGTRQGNDNAEIYATDPDLEITETCSAGAGSLVLEFTVLSRLTGDGRYEELAKRAFWAVWLRRSEIGLIGSGIDAESGRWVTPYTGVRFAFLPSSKIRRSQLQARVNIRGYSQIGAGIDSFFEYAFKSYILLSSGARPDFDARSPWLDMDNYYVPLSEEYHSAEAFLKVWRDAHTSINRHLYRGPGYQHPHFVQGDIHTGATRAFWIDSLSAYYPGLLTLAGDIEEATEIHLLATALWTRFSALPERWNVATGDVDNGLGWWGGRPEFIESTYYLYRATKDPWYLYVGEMVLRDIKRRCWTRCGWAGLQDVRNGELNDRMESFFLGETAKYMFLLFDPAHPLNSLDAPYVFSTEGHPLIVPRSGTGGYRGHKTKQPVQEPSTAEACQPAPDPLPFGFSSTAARSDIFHAASLARLHKMPSRKEAEGVILEYATDHPSVSLSDLSSPSNYTFYPWTLPPELVPFNATSSPMAVRPTLDISFPNLPGMVLGPGSLERVRDGVLLKAIGGLRLGMVQDVPLEVSSSSHAEGFRIQVINNLPLGKDERVYLSREITFDILNPSDPNFSRIRDPVMIDIVIDVESDLFNRGNHTSASADRSAPEQRDPLIHEHSSSLGSSGDKLGRGYSHASGMKTAFSALMDHVSSILRDDVQPSALRLSQSKDKPARLSLPAITSGGPGSAPLPEVDEASVFTYSGKPSLEPLTWSTIYLADEICDYRLPLDVVRYHQVLVIKRGGCSFSQKLRNIPAYPPSDSALQLVIVVSYEESEELNAASKSGRDLNMNERSFLSTSPPTSPLYPAAAILAESLLVRPYLDEAQVTASGIPRRHPVSLVMVGGGDNTYALLRSSTGLGIRRRYMVRSQGVPISNLYII
jgi:hypothetical protein